MQITLLEEAGYGPAMEGLSLSYLQPVENMPGVAMKLIHKGEPHCKFMRQMHVWLRITAPWYWWKQMATYRIGVETQSSSTMHSVMKRPLTQADFQYLITDMALYVLNRYIKHNKEKELYNALPGGYLYTRVVDFSYSALRNIFRQRKNHKLPEWQEFVHQVTDQVEYPEFLA